MIMISSVTTGRELPDDTKSIDFFQLTLYWFYCIGFSELPVLTVYMPSDNDGESVSSSGSGCPSPVPAAKARHGIVAGKGILVHNNKKSANTNRVSFVTSSTSSSSSSNSLPSSNKRSKRKQHQNQNKNSTENKTPFYARTGRRLTGFGVKSYIHEFYDDPEVGDSFQVGKPYRHSQYLLLFYMKGNPKYLFRSINS